MTTTTKNHSTVAKKFVVHLRSTPGFIMLGKRNSMAGYIGLSTCNLVNNIIKGLYPKNSSNIMVNFKESG